MAISCAKISNHRGCLKSCVKNRSKHWEVFKMIKKLFGDNTMSQPRVCESYKYFHVHH